MDSSIGSSDSPSLEASTAATTEARTEHASTLTSQAHHHAPPLQEMLPNAIASTRDLQQALPVLLELPASPDNDAAVEADKDPEEADGPLVIPRHEDMQNVDIYGFFQPTSTSASSERPPSTSSAYNSISRRSIFRRSNASSQSAEDSVQLYRKRENQWIQIIGDWDRFYKPGGRNSLIKNLCRKGIPLSLRGRVWYLLANADSFRKAGVYQEMVAQEPLGEIYDTIDRDLNRCYPDHFLDKQALGQKNLADILRAYAHYDPVVGYCQGMGRLVGLMLMQMPAEDSFWLLVATLKTYLSGYYTASLDRFRIHAMVFEQLLYKHAAPLAKFLDENDVSPLVYMTQWFLTVFTMVLPWNTVLRVWDMFYCDGVKVMFRVALAIMLQIKDHLLKHCPSSSEILQFILHIPEEYLGLELIERSLAIDISRAEISALEGKASGIWLAQGSPQRGTLSMRRK